MNVSWLNGWYRDEMGPNGGEPGQGNGEGWTKGAWSGARGGLEEEVTKPRRPLPTWPREPGRDRWWVSVKKPGPGRKG